MSDPIIEINPYDRARSILHLSMAETEQHDTALELRLRRVRDHSALGQALHRHPQARLHSGRRILRTQHTVTFDGPTSEGLALLRTMSSLER